MSAISFIDGIERREIREGDEDETRDSRVDLAFEESFCSLDIGEETKHPDEEHKVNTLCTLQFQCSACEGAVVDEPQV